MGSPCSTTTDIEEGTCDLVVDREVKGKRVQNNRREHINTYWRMK